MSAVSRPELFTKIDALARSASSAEDLMRGIVTTLRDSLPSYDWVGFYMIEERPGEAPVLVLGPFVGAETPHTRIPLHQGICGAAASSGETVVVDDVHSDPRYLACSLETKSEIVAPIYSKRRVVGELDIDSHTPAAFGVEDRELVEHCARVVGEFLDRT